MYEHCVLICSMGALILHVPSLVLVGLDASKEYLLVLDRNMLYTPHAWTLSWFRSFSYLGVSSYYFLGPAYKAYYRDQTTDVNV